MIDRVVNTSLIPSVVPVLHEQFQIIYKKGWALYTAKIIRVWSFFDLYFLAFGLNADIYFITLCIQYK